MMLPQRPLIYIAGPYSAPTAEGRQRNVDAALDVCRQVMEMGADAVAPHEAWHRLFGQLPEQTFLAAGLNLLERCDGLVLLPGWETSRGTMAEIQQWEGAIFAWGHAPSMDALRQWIALVSMPEVEEC